jgi:adenosylmethionine-8-amino-7-oxononanoate aminotransferase
VAGYFRAIREVCTRHGVLLILDEVMCGMGRTGRTYACQEDGIEPDILLVGKGLGAGYIPISAMLVRPELHDAIARGTGSLRNGQTFVNHPLACATALEVQRVIEEDGLLDNVRRRGEQLRGLLGELVGEHPNVGDLRGRGLFLAIELVADRATKAPLPPDKTLPSRIKAAGLRRGLMIYPMGGTIDGKTGDHVMFAPPFISTEEQIRTIATLFAEIMSEIFPTARSAR